MTRKSMTSNLRVAFVLIALFSFHACDLLEEPKPPTWTNTIEFPLVKESVTLESLEDEANISSQLYDSTGTRRIFAYSDTSTMDTQSVGDQLKFDNITQSFSQSVDDVTVTGSSINQANSFDPVGIDPINEVISTSIGKIELSKIDPAPTAPVTLKDIAPGIEALEGQTDSIPSSDIGPIYRDHSFTDFSNADFESGKLMIEITNNMIIPLGAPLNIDLMTDNGPDTTVIPGLSVVFDPAINEGATRSEVIDLANKSLPGEIIVRISGFSYGSNQVPKTINSEALNSSFSVSVGTDDNNGTEPLVVTSATASVPQQQFDEQDAIELATSDNKVESAAIKNGSLAVKIKNSMAVESTLALEITSLKTPAPSSSSFTQSYSIPADDSVSVTTSIDDHSLVMDILNQIVEYSYIVTTADTEGSLVPISETDSVTVEISLFGATEGEQLYFSTITGEIAPQTIDENGDIDVSSDSKIISADISAGSISISIDNQINSEGTTEGLPEITLTINELLDSNSDPLTGSMPLRPSPLENTLNFDLANYTLVFPNKDTQILTYSTRVTTPANETGSFELEDSIIVNIEVADMVFSRVTGFFSQDAMVDSNEIVLDEGTKLKEAVFETGDLQLTMTNGIGVVAEVKFQIDEFKHKVTNQSLAVRDTLEDVLGPQVIPVDLSEYNLVFDTPPISGVDQAIHYVSSVALPDDQQMTLTFGQDIDIDVNITNLAMESVTGIIEPDTLNIEESEQEIDMPDMVSDLKFEKVNIDIDFNSSFEIPIKLSLFLSGTNSEDGAYEQIDTTFNLTPQNDRITIDAAPLLNIHPDAIISSGMAVVGGGEEESTIAKGQMMAPVMYINVPLSLIIEDPPFIEMDAEGVDSPLPDDETISLEEVTIFVEAINLFEFGANVVLLASDDSTELDSVRLAQGLADPDTLISFEILPKENAGVTDDLEVNEIVLENGQISIIEDRFFIKPQIQLLGQGSQPARFFTTDSLSMKTWGSVSYTVHGDQLTEEEE